ncbi:MAG: hypothetical protein J6A73_02120 [Lachnospiraceae bacterium]|nr:hypothetical protein [Lachnospiraceae bacterium]
MNIAILASVIVFCIWLAYEIRKHNKQDKKVLDSFWEKEQKANATRAKSLDSLNYIEIPESVYNALPSPLPADLEDTAKLLQHLKENKIVNLSHITNTDLKLKYGASNLDTLSAYDQNYITLLRVLQTLSDYHYERGNIDTARTLLEFAVSIQSDNIGTYKMLAKIYCDSGENAKLDYLISAASLLPGLTQKPILRFLKSLRPEDTDSEESILDILD